MQFVKNLLIANKQNKYRPHIIRRHGLALAFVLIIGIQLIGGISAKNNSSVLGYASDINQGALLTYTNNNRVSNGLPAFTNNSKLASAAQNKANHMIANDYWSHIAPDGTTPWYFFDQAGYAYLVAGENLAYGFDTSLGVVNGWMASQTHKDNILLPAYEEIGFGIASGPDYQGGENTVVVAFYGDPVTNTTPVAAPVQTTPSSPPPTKVAAAPKAPVVTEPAPVPVETPAKLETVVQEEIIDPGVVEPLTFLPQSEKQITNLELVLNGNANWTIYATVLILGMLVFAYLYRHITYLNAVIAKTEQTIVAHPLLESSIIFAALWLLLTATSGTIL